MQVRVAYHTITWGNDFLRALDEIAEVGYKAFETFGLEEYYSRMEEFKELVARRGLTLTSIYCGGSFIDGDKLKEEISQIRRTIEFLNKMGCSQVILGGGQKKEEGNTAEDYQTMASALNEIGKIAQDSGLQACYHPHSGTMVENRQQLSWLCESTDSDLIFLALDTAHLVRGGADPVEVFRTYSDRIKYVHFKDIRNNEFVELGEGIVNFPEVIKVLEENNYYGWLVVELDNTRLTPRISAMISKKYLEGRGIKL